MMRAAYLYQVVNLMVGILMVPILLRFLNVQEYILWAIFTTFGGITLQFENAIQVVTVREIAREYNSGVINLMREAVNKARLAYFALSGLVLTLFAGIGLIYLNFIVSERIGSQWNKEWLIFIFAYAINYFFGKNNSLLLGMKQIAMYNYINSFTRILNLLLIYIFLKAGFSIMGIAISFIIAVLTGCTLIGIRAYKTLYTFYSFQRSKKKENPNINNSEPPKIFMYTLFTLSSFILYKSGILVVSGFFPQDIASSYALALQVYTMLSAFALVPIQVWLSRLVSAIAKGNQSAIMRELVVTLFVVNSLFIAGTIILLIFGNYLLLLIGSKIRLLGSVNLIFMCIAFLVEINIFLLVNILVTSRNYKFVKIYICTSLVSFLFALFFVWLSKELIFSLIVVPTSLQLTICLPLIFNLVCRELKTNPKYLISQIKLNLPRLK